jgi:uncharacterized protein YndB with AHSA1/START domain
MAEETTPTHPWHEFDMSIYIAAEREEVWRAWATPSGLCRWFVKDATFETPGDQQVGVDESPPLGSTFTWRWLASEFTMSGHVLKMSEGSELGFTFGPGVRVLVELDIDDGQTRVRLSQEGMPESDAGRQLFVDCYGGWTFYLTNLKSVLEGGLDLRERIGGRGHTVNM